VRPTLTSFACRPASRSKSRRARQRPTRRSRGADRPSGHPCAHLGAPPGEIHDDHHAQNSETAAALSRRVTAPRADTTIVPATAVDLANSPPPIGRLDSHGNAPLVTSPQRDAVVGTLPLSDSGTVARRNGPPILGRSDLATLSRCADAHESRARQATSLPRSRLEPGQASAKQGAAAERCRRGPPSGKTAKVSATTRPPKGPIGPRADSSRNVRTMTNSVDSGVRCAIKADVRYMANSRGHAQSGR